jgi:hypothetical protein
MDIKDLEHEIKQLTVAEIAAKTEKSERYVKTYLTRNGVSCLDYDGEAKKAAAIQRLAEEEKRAAAQREKREAEKRSGQTAASAMIANEKESDSLFTTVSVLYGLVWFGLTLWGFSANGAAFFLFWLLMSFGFFMASMMTWSSLSDSAEKNRLNRMSSIEQSLYTARKDAVRAAQNEILARHRAIDRYGLPNANLVCPHCQTKGSVRSKSAEEVTSTKVIPIIGNNIKARKMVTQMHCDNCDTTWNV